MDNLCCRCLRDIKEPLGGKFGGVVCIYHRSCQSCWWETVSCYGHRKTEKKETKNIALVDGPRKGMRQECFGCFYQIEDHVDAQERFTTKELGSKSDPIII